MRGLIRATVKALDRTQEVLITVSVIVILFSVFGLVLTRYVFKLYAPYLEELPQYLLVLIVFVGCAVATRNRAHINIGVLPTMVRNKSFVTSLSLISDLILFGLFAFFSFLSFNYMRHTFTMPAHSLSMPWLHIGWTRALMFAGSVLTTIAFLVTVIKDAMALRSKN